MSNFNTFADIVSFLILTNISVIIAYIYISLFKFLIDKLGGRNDTE